MEFYLMSWIDFDIWRNDISCRQWSLAFPKTKSRQRQRQSCTNAAEHIVERERRGEWEREAGNLRLRESDRNTELETDRTKTDQETVTGETKRQKQQSPVLQQNQSQPAWQMKPTADFLQSDSCALISLQTMGTCQHSQACLAPLQTFANKCDLCTRQEL